MRQSTLRQQRAAPEGEFRQTFRVAEDLHQVHVGDAVEGKTESVLRNGKIGEKHRSSGKAAPTLDLLDVDEDDF